MTGLIGANPPHRNDLIRSPGSGFLCLYQKGGEKGSDHKKTAPKSGQLPPRQSAGLTPCGWSRPGCHGRIPVPCRPVFIGDGAALLLFQEADPGEARPLTLPCWAAWVKAEAPPWVLLLKIGDPGQELSDPPLFTAGVGGRLGGEGHQILVALALDHHARHLELQIGIGGQLGTWPGCRWPGPAPWPDASSWQRLVVGAVLSMALPSWPFPSRGRRGGECRRRRGSWRAAAARWLGQHAEVVGPSSAARALASLPACMCMAESWVQYFFFSGNGPPGRSAPRWPVCTVSARSGPPSSADTRTPAPFARRGA